MKEDKGMNKIKRKRIKRNIFSIRTENSGVNTIEVKGFLVNKLN